MINEISSEIYIYKNQVYLNLNVDMIRNPLLQQLKTILILRKLNLYIYKFDLINYNLYI